MRIPVPLEALKGGGSGVLVGPATDEPVDLGGEDEGDEEVVGDDIEDEELKAMLVEHLHLYGIYYSHIMPSESHWQDND